MKWRHLRLITVATAALAVAGCGPTMQYAKPGATAADLERNQAQCNYEAEAATAAIVDPAQRGWQSGGLIASCMKARGWVMQPVSS
jgi:hypothetical protein